MPTVIREYEECMTPAVAAFNERLAAAGSEWRFPASAVPHWLPRRQNCDIYQQLFVAMDEPATVRGGYCIKHEVYRIAGREQRIGQIALPLSEGIVDRRFAQVGTQLLLHAIHQQPLLYALGMGGYREPITHLVQAAHWRVVTLPFHFRIVRPTGFLRNIQSLRRARFSGILPDLLAASGLGWLGCRAANLLLARRPAPPPELETERFDEFGDWADRLWADCAGRYPYIAVRNAATLRALYPKHDPRFIRLKVSQSGRPVGWAVLLATDLDDHRHFGNMRLGSIVDVFAAPEDAEKIVFVAKRVLCQEKVDLIISNQAHASWSGALRHCGFLGGPSNFLLATSRKLTELLDNAHISTDQLHLNRGDGDGPINL
jgi:hypothetical protein